MSIQFSNTQIKRILNELKDELYYEHIDYSDVNYDEIENLLTSEPVSKYLPPPNSDYEKELPPLNENGEYEYIRYGEKVVIPVKFAPMVRFSYYNFSGTSSAILPSRSLFDKIWEYIENFLRWVFSNKGKILGQLEYILKNADKHYQELRDRMKKVKMEYDDDNLFEILMLIPDCFVYLCRLLVDSRVPKEYKIEVVLALIYLISPIDFIPEGMVQHPIALLDDTGIVLFVIKRGFDEKYISKEILEEHWPGDVVLIKQIGEWYEAVKNVIGKNFIENIFNYHKSKVEKKIV